MVLNHLTEYKLTSILHSFIPRGKITPSYWADKQIYFRSTLCLKEFCSDESDNSFSSTDSPGFSVPALTMTWGLSLLRVQDPLGTCESLPLLRAQDPLRTSEEVSHCWGLKTHLEYVRKSLSAEGWRSTCYTRESLSLQRAEDPLRTCEKVSHCWGLKTHLEHARKSLSAECLRLTWKMWEGLAKDSLGIHEKPKPSCRR